MNHPAISPQTVQPRQVESAALKMKQLINSNVQDLLSEFGHPAFRRYDQPVSLHASAPRRAVGNRCPVLSGFRRPGCYGQLRFARQTRKLSRWVTRSLPDLLQVEPGLYIAGAGYFACDDSVVVGKPASIQELQAQVQQYDRVKAVGVGHSWWQQQFCSGSDTNAVNIALTQLNSTLAE